MTELVREWQDQWVGG